MFFRAFSAYYSVSAAFRGMAVFLAVEASCYFLLGLAVAAQLPGGLFHSFLPATITRLRAVVGRRGRIRWVADCYSC
jgi:hypothetical protein